ncbi:DUF1461 domain-containing protein [Thioalkalivibrio sp. ALMg11]|uniref:lipoprotein intramolecular transacylase Lit n=1 Tax=Thioalkalivibrio sp. ALMg11 TaxID=1158165 RepID=UPI0003632545|nr:DUF1461 domain-containing protein [Thioalkalivibrio sp. ALMg11]
MRGNAGRLGARLRWTGIVLTSSAAALFLAWKLLAAVGFAYPLWYDVLGIDETIANYGPQNDIRPGFERTGKDERVRLFAAMAQAIQDPDTAESELAALTYSAPGAGTPEKIFLTDPEIRHLVDVSRLVGWGERAGWISLALLAALMLWARAGRDPPPSLKRTGIGVVSAVGALMVCVWLIGPVRVFYALHDVLFPPENPWFFWYEESLMSMLMQAPNLFGPIAASWALLALVLLAAGFYGLRHHWYSGAQIPVR